MKSSNWYHGFTALALTLALTGTAGAQMGMMGGPQEQVQRGPDGAVEIQGSSGGCCSVGGMQQGGQPGAMGMMGQGGQAGGMGMMGQGGGMGMMGGCPMMKQMMQQRGGMQGHGMQGHMDMHGGRHGHRAMRMLKRAERLDELADEDRATLREARQDLRRTMLTGKADLLDARDAIHDLVHAEETDEERLREAFRESADIKADMTLARIEAMRTLKETLSEEQLETLKKKHRDRRGGTGMMQPGREGTMRGPMGPGTMQEGEATQPQREGEGHEEHH